MLRLTDKHVRVADKSDETRVRPLIGARSVIQRNVFLFSVFHEIFSVSDLLRAARYGEIKVPIERTSVEIQFFARFYIDFGICRYRSVKIILFGIFGVFIISEKFIPVRQSIFFRGFISFRNRYVSGIVRILVRKVINNLIGFRPLCVKRDVFRNFIGFEIPLLCVTFVRIPARYACIVGILPRNDNHGFVYRRVFFDLFVLNVRRLQIRAKIEMHSNNVTRFRRGIFARGRIPRVSAVFTRNNDSHTQSHYNRQS